MSNNTAFVKWFRKHRERQERREAARLLRDGVEPEPYKHRHEALWEQW